MALAGATGAGLIRNGRRHSMVERPDFWDKTLDLELGMRRRDDESIIVEGSGTNQH